MATGRRPEIHSGLLLRGSTSPGYGPVEFPSVPTLAQISSDP